MSKYYDVTFENYIDTLTQLASEMYNGYELTHCMNKESYKGSLYAYNRDDDTKLGYYDWLEDYVANMLMEGI